MEQTSIQLIVHSDFKKFYIQIIFVYVFIFIQYTSTFSKMVEYNQIGKQQL